MSVITAVHPDRLVLQADWRAAAKQISCSFVAILCVVAFAWCLAVSKDVCRFWILPLFTVNTYIQAMCSVDYWRGSQHRSQEQRNTIISQCCFTHYLECVKVFKHHSSEGLWRCWRYMFAFHLKNSCFCSVSASVSREYGGSCWVLTGLSVIEPIKAVFNGAAAHWNQSNRVLWFNAS